MNTRHGDKKRKVMWDISKAPSTEIASVLTERNAEQPMPEQLQQPPPAMTPCSDSHLCAQKEASNACAPSIEAIDIDQGGSEDLGLIDNRRSHMDIIKAFRKEHGEDYFPPTLIEKNYPHTKQGKKHLNNALRGWASNISSYKFHLISSGNHVNVVNGKKGKGDTYKYKCKNCNFKILAEENAEGGLSITRLLNRDHSEECRKENTKNTTTLLVAKGVNSIPDEYWDKALIFAHAQLELPKINSALKKLYLVENTGAEIPWTRRHLYRRLRKENLVGRGNDKDLVDFLNTRAMCGTHARFWTNPSSNAIESIYWEMPKAKEKVGRGLNCVFYDTTHGTNHCKMKLGLFIASNENGRSIVLAITLMANETATTFHNFFTEFKKNFSAPKVIFTDGDPAMACAVNTALPEPETKHLLCIYHLQQNFDNSYRKSLLVGPNAEKFAQRLNRMMYYDADRKYMESFPDDWKALIELLPKEHQELYAKVAADKDVAEFESSEEKFLLESVKADDELEAEILSENVREFQEKFRSKRTDHESAIIWLYKMFKRHEKWHRAFVMSKRTLGAFSTQRSESMHAALKQYAGGNQQIKKMNLCSLLQLIENMQNDQDQNAVLESLRRENKNIFPPTFLSEFQKEYTPYAYDVVLKKYYNAMNHCSFDDVIYQQACVNDKLAHCAEVMEVVVIQEIQVQNKGETVPRTVLKPYYTNACSCSCQFLTNTGLPCEHIIFFCMKLMGMGRPMYPKLPVDKIKVDHFWKKRLPVVLLDDDDDDDENPNPNPTDDDDYDTILDIKTDDDFTRKEKLEYIRKTLYNKCDGLIENCPMAAVSAFVNNVNRFVDEYTRDKKDVFPNADEVFIDEKTNRPYTAPQRNRGGGGRESTKRKENAAALGRKAAAKKFN
jgi:hypothetical protein